MILSGRRLHRVPLRSHAVAPVQDLRDLPKAHLHVHLENTIRWPTLRELGLANGIDVPGHLTEGRYAFTGFSDFFAQNALVRSRLSQPADFRRIAVEYCEDEAAQGTRYAEVSFTAAAHGQRVGDMPIPLAAVLDGLAEGSERYGVEARVVLDHSRRRSVEQAIRTVELAVEYADSGVVAVGLAGDEAYPLEPFAEVFADARSRGMHVVHHAGEALGPDSVWTAIGAGGAERVGHGIRALEDEALVDELRNRHIPLEVCPSSNVALGFAPSLPTHPFPRLVAAGLTVTINSDIPAMIATPLAVEYSNIRTAFRYDDAAMAAFATASVDASFASVEVKDAIRAEIRSWLAHVGS